MTVWKKSSFSGEGGNNCIELAVVGSRVALRESTSPEVVITVSPARLRAFLDQVKAGSRAREL